MSKGRLLDGAARVWARARPRLLPCAVSIGLLASLALVVDLDAVPGVVAAARPELLLLMLASTIGERLFAAWRWRVLLRLADPRAPGFGPVLRITFASNFVGVFLPGGVGIEVLRAYGLARLTADLPLALSSILVERLCGLLALLSMVALGLLLAPIALPGPLQALVVGVALGLLGGAVALAHPAPRALLRRLLSQLRLPRAAAAVAGLERRLDAYRSRPRALAWSFLLALAFQGHRVLTVVIGAFALGLPGEALLLVLVVPVAILVGLLPVSLGGLGPREATYVALLGLGGVAPAPALVLALTREVLNLVATLPGAFLRLGGPVAQAAGS